MTWKNAFQRAVKKESEPMRQITHWALFLAVGFTYVLKTVEGAAAASHELIAQNPDIVSTSWLANSWFM